MKKLFIIGLLSISLLSFAQGKKGSKRDRENPTSEQKVDQQVKRLTNELSLNEKQVKEIRIIIEKEVAKREDKKSEMVALRDQKKQERKEFSENRKTQLQAEQVKVSAEMKNILTPEQFTKWEKMKAERKDNRKEKMGERKEKRQNKN